MSQINTKASSLWNIKGNFGNVEGDVAFSDNSFSSEYNNLFVFTENEEYKNGVVCRKGFVRNDSDKEIILNTLSSKFLFNGGEYEVYTQCNFWENESRGGWSELISEIAVTGKSIRNCIDAVPFMVLWNKQTNRGVAFHTVAYSTWKMKTVRIHSAGATSDIQVEIGVDPDSFSYSLKPGEKLELPQIIYYDIKNKHDMDAYKLHDYINELYPRREMPVIYNTWLYKFDRIDCENVLSQLKRAKELGVEYFVIDAGWFGNGQNWNEWRGDYEENLTFGFKGKMKEVAQAVREHGMKFGFWIEIECASIKSVITKTHPEYFIKTDSGSWFLDFSKEAARKYILDKITYFVDRFEAKFIKFDFNADLYYDLTQSGFYGYFNGWLKLIDEIKEKYPDLYMENCASGGMRMGIRDGELFDSFWLSDNQSPYAGIRILKESILRMPPQMIERWAVVKSVENFAPIYASNEYSEKLISTDDATISNVIGVNLSYLKAFLTGGPIGFSCDLNQLSDKAFSELKEFISDIKKEREFWLNANCRILTDTETMLVLQYSDKEMSKIKIVVISEKSAQNKITVYPVLKNDFKYILDGETEYEGYELSEKGFDVCVDNRYSANTVNLERIIE